VDARGSGGDSRLAPRRRDHGRPSSRAKRPGRGVKSPCGSPRRSPARTHTRSRPSRIAAGPERRGQGFRLRDHEGGRPCLARRRLRRREAHGGSRWRVAYGARGAGYPRGDLTPRRDARRESGRPCRGVAEQAGVPRAPRPVHGRSA
jgi:hypothetical protein